MLMGRARPDAKRTRWQAGEAVGAGPGTRPLPGVAGRWGRPTGPGASGMRGLAAPRTSGLGRVRSGHRDRVGAVADARIGCLGRAAAAAEVVLVDVDDLDAVVDVVERDRVVGPVQLVVV